MMDDSRYVFMTAIILWLMGLIAMFWYAVLMFKAGGSLSWVWWVCLAVWACIPELIILGVFTYSRCKAKSQSSRE